MQSIPLAYGILEACTVSCLGRTTLYAAIKSGDLVARKIGRRTVITADDLKSWLNNRPSAREERTSVTATPMDFEGRGRSKNGSCS
jgi:excisionase family DNA binding protein